MLSFLTSACFGCHRQMSLAQYQRALSSGCARIRPAREMEELFGECDHMITYKPGQPSVWQSTVVVEGRYELAMECRVRLSEQLDSVVEVVDAPVFYINEITKVDVEASGVVTMESQGQHATFGVDKWERIVATGGDLSAGGIDFKRDKPVPNVSEYSRQLRRSRDGVRPKGP